MQNLNEQGINRKVDEYFNKFDANKNNILEKDEAVLFLNSFFKSMGRNINGETLDAVFKLIDSNGDGQITKPEMAEIIKKCEVDYQNKMNRTGTHTTAPVQKQNGTGQFQQERQVNSQPQVVYQQQPQAQQQVVYQKQPQVVYQQQQPQVVYQQQPPQQQYVYQQQQQPQVVYQQQPPQQVVYQQQPQNTQYRQQWTQPQ